MEFKNELKMKLPKIQCFLLLIFLFVAFCARAQNATIPSSSNHASTSNLSFEIGYFFRSTALEGVWQNYTLPLNYEKNLQGTGLLFGAAYRFSQRFEVIYGFGLRYDHKRFTIKHQALKEIKDLFFDHEVGLRYYFWLKDSKFYLTAEYNHINTNSSIQYNNKIHNLSFNSGSLGLGYLVWKVILESKISFVGPKNPYNAYQNFEFITLSASYRIYI